jgi:hypothetical protein
MKPLLIATAAAAVLAAGSAAAQTQIRAGQTLEGRIGADSARASDGTPYDLYVYRGEAGERVRVTMNSAAFDAYLAVGTRAAPDCEGDCRTNDDGGGGTNSAITATVPAGGVLQIRANTVGADETGAYTLSLANAPAAPRATPKPVTLNREATGALGPDSPRDDADLPFELWTVKGRPGQNVTVRMRSGDFDTLAGFGTMVNGSYVEAQQDDDGGPGTNSRLNVTLDERGEGVVKAASYNGDSAGTYTLFVGDPPPPRPVRAQEATIGEAVRGRLDGNDAVTPEEEIAFDVYLIKGRPGQRVTARMESSDFDALLRWGVFDAETFIEDASNDDGGGDTSALLTVTLDEDGIGRLVATSLDGATGGYTLSLVAAPRPAR